MNEFKIVFYIIIGVGWLIFNIYKKRAENNKGANKDTAPRSGLDTIFDIVKPYFNNDQPVRTPVKTPVINKNITSVSKTEKKKSAGRIVEKRKPFVRTAEVTSDLQKHEMPSPVFDSDALNTVNAEKNNLEESVFIEKKFDIRSAIIFSEILKRPDF